MTKLVFIFNIWIAETCRRLAHLTMMNTYVDTLLFFLVFPQKAALHAFTGNIWPQLKRGVPLNLLTWSLPPVLGNPLRGAYVVEM